MERMGLLIWSREITVAGFAADPAPYTTPPSADKIWRVDRQISGNRLMGGHFLVGAFDTEEATGAVGFTTWWRDDGTSLWHILSDPATLTHRKVLPSTAVLPGDLFVQVQSLANVGAATKFTLRGGPRGAV